MLVPTAVDNEVSEVLWKRRSGLPQHQLGSFPNRQGVRKWPPAVPFPREAEAVWSIRNLLVTAVALLGLFGIGISNDLAQSGAAQCGLGQRDRGYVAGKRRPMGPRGAAHNLALNAADPAADAQKSAIANFRKLGYQPFEQALAGRGRKAFANKDQMIAGAARMAGCGASVRARGAPQITRNHRRA